MTEPAFGARRIVHPADSLSRGSLLVAAGSTLATLASVPLLPFASFLGQLIILALGTALAASTFAFGAMLSLRNPRARTGGFVASAVALCAGAVLGIVAFFVSGWSRVLFGLWGAGALAYAVFAINSLVRSPVFDAPQKIKSGIGVFISYRREDAIETVGRIYDHLKDDFDESRLFLDVDRQVGGSDFRTSIREALSRSDVVLVVIGASWLGVRDEWDHRRLDDPNDWVRVEIEFALNANVRTIPVLVQGARMPRADELPASLRDLSYRMAVSVRPDPDFKSDIERLVSELKRSETVQA